MMRQSRDAAQSVTLSLAQLLAPDPSVASAAEQMLWRCARVSPSDATLAEIQRLGGTFDADDWARVAALAQRHGVEQLFFTHIFAAGLGSALPAPLALRLRARFGAATLRARRLERRLEALLPLLESAGAAVIPLKGALLARRYYGGVTLRPITDIDLLVRREEETHWSAAFRAAGLSPVKGRGDTLSGHTLRFRELQFRDASGLLVEAHLTPCRLPSYRQAFPLAEIWANAQPAVIHGVNALTLPLADEIRFLSMHYAAQHQASRLIWLTDVAELLRARGDELAWERFVDETTARRIAAPVAITLLRAQTLLDAPVPQWAAARLLAAALTAPEQRAWAESQARMETLSRFLAQTLSLDSGAERLRLLRSGGASLARRIRRTLSRAPR